MVRVEGIETSCKCSEAFALWLASRVSIAPKTRHCYRNHFKVLSAFFGERPIDSLTFSDLHEFRQARLLVCGSNAINKETDLLKRVMKAFDCWDRVARFYERLPKSAPQVGIALEPEEEAHLFSVAAAEERWRVAYLCSLLSRNTGAGPGELRHLTLGNIDTKDFAWIRVVRGVKNRFRVRTVPCEGDARWALEALYRRARSLGAKDAEHYLLPFRRRNHGKFEFDKPMTHWHKQWYELRREAGKKYPRIRTLRIYDMRHTFETNLLENPQVPYNVIERLMGHAIDSDMRRVYDHIRDRALQQAVQQVATHYCAKARVESAA